MSLAVGVSLDGVRIPLSRARVMAIARSVLRSERIRDALLSITFVTNRSIRAMNREHLKRDALTDVIAFGFRHGGRNAAIVGDVYVAPDVARASARANGVTLRQELTRLVVHGVLHVLGHDHPEDDRRTRSPMWRTQERIVRALESREA
jgi:probable rRNA maturation factor